MPYRVAIFHWKNKCINDHKNGLPLPVIHCERLVLINEFAIDKAFTRMYFISPIVQISSYFRISLLLGEDHLEETANQRTSLNIQVY